MNTLQGMPPPVPRRRDVDDARQDWRLDQLEASVKAIETRLDLLSSQVTAEFAHSRAQGSSETMKILVGGVVAIVTAIAGSFGVQQLSKQPPQVTTVSRSAFDRALDACRQLPDATRAGECISRVTIESVTGPAK
jgi:hypothetical protein